ncbi:MAG TPA: hypothetical protein VNX46_01735 [Candidatus Acidoferrum sp.]|jgi:hypothetical protein|nr:hypothetical protein [Candidatus Acidoferrum sp.]
MHIKADLMTHLTKLTANRFARALAVATGLAASTLSTQAQSATATISEVAAAGGDFDYTLTLKNTGNQNLNSFWYGWTTSGNNLPSDPISAANSLGWVSSITGNSIQWGNSSYSYYGYTYYYGTPLAAGQSATFTFVSTSTLSAITQSPSGESVAYVSGIDGSQGVTGDSTAVFSPTIAAVPEPSSMGVVAAGSLILAAGFKLRKERSKAS